MNFLAFTKHTPKLNCYIYFKNQIRYISKNRGINTVNDSYCHEIGTFRYFNLTLSDLVDKAAEEHGDNVAFVLPFQNIRKTFDEFKKDVDHLATGLIDLGLQKGDRFAIWGPNSYEWIITQYATFKAGLVSVVINPAYKATELEYALKKVECKAIVSAEVFKTQNYYKILCDVLPELPHSKSGEIQYKNVSSLRYVIQMGSKTLPGTYNLKEIIQANGNENQKLLNERKENIQSDDDATIMFTSGTTGKPKAATLSHFQMVNQGTAAVRNLGFDIKPPVICLQVPLFHVFGCLGGPLLALLSRGTCVCPDEHFNPISSLKAIEKEKCTVVYGTPTMFIDLLTKLSNYNINSLEKVLIGAAPVPDELAKQFEKLGLIVINGYGATETCGALTLSTDSVKMGSTGRPLEHVEVKIIDSNNKIVPVNTNGEILVRSQYVFKGYWNEKDKTDEVVDSARWYHTGDAGRMDENGIIYVTGRIKDLVIRGGENIYPEEVENLLLSHPDVTEVYVVGVPDPRMGEELCACIRLNPDRIITEEDIKKYCNGKISYFKIPRYIRFCQDYPKTETGKVQKYKLRDECCKILNL